MRILRGVMLWFFIIVVIGVVALWLMLRSTLTVPPSQALTAGEELLQSKKTLAIVAHPDDVEWWISGTLKRLVDNGADVRVVVASDGEKGPNRVNSSDLRKTRQQEQLEASKVIGYSHVYFLSLPDREVIRQSSLIPELNKIITDFSPDTIITFDGDIPALPYLHPDHEGIGRVVARLFKELPTKPRVFLFHTRRPNVAIDITSVIDDKIRALQAHKSQGLGGSDERIRRYNNGKMANVEYAEYFRRVN